MNGAERTNGNNAEPKPAMILHGRYVMVPDEAGQPKLEPDYGLYVKDGIIEESAPYAALRSKYPEAAVVGNGRQLLMPGLIDAHSHGEGISCVQRGITYDFLENALTDFDTAICFPPAICSLMTAVKHIRNGGTSIHHNNWSNLTDEGQLADSRSIIRAYRSTGIRLAFSPGGRNKNILAYDDEAFCRTLPPDLQEKAKAYLIDDPEEMVDRYMEVFEQLYAEFDGQDKTSVFFGPSWAHGSTDSFLCRVKERADELGKIPIHIHCLQSPVQKVYALQCRGMSWVEYLDKLGLVDSNLVLGHGVYLTANDLDILAAGGAGVTSHPSCNLIVRNGIAPVMPMLNRGICVALGLDDKGINDDEDPFMEMRMFYFLHRQQGYLLGQAPELSPETALSIATKNGAKVLGLADRTGTLEPGKQADCILVDLEEILEDPWVTDAVSMLRVIVHRALGRHVDTVVIGGEIVMQGRRILTVDEESLYQEIRAIGAAKGACDMPEERAFLYQLRPYLHSWYNSWLEQTPFEPFYTMNSRI